MITEDYVSFDTAKLLKEKGFNEDSWFHYDADGDIVTRGYRLNMPEDIPAWTHQMVMKWLREVHNMIIVPNIRVDDQTSSIINCYIVGIWYVPKNNGGAFCYTSPTPYNGYPSYEEACESAIKYCIENLI